MASFDPVLIYGTPGPVDVLALAAHPDDVELCVGGTLLNLVRAGHTTAIVDLTRGELGTRGTPEQRLAESHDAAEILGLTARENLGLPDGDLANSRANRLRVVEAVRRYRPHVLLVNAPECRHPDHPAAATLSVEANFYAGLAQIQTVEPDGTPQAPHRAAHVLHMMQSVEFEPTLVVDVSDVWERRMEAFFAYRSQFHDPAAPPDEAEPQTFISNPDFTDWVAARAQSYGYRIGARRGEPLLYRHGPFGADDLMAVFAKAKRFA